MRLNFPKVSNQNIELQQLNNIKQLEKSCEGKDIKVSSQESKSFWSYNSLRPDIVLRKGSKTYIIDTKWKRPKNSTASVSDLRQMYTYCRFWDAEKPCYYIQVMQGIIILNLI